MRANGEDFRIAVNVQSTDKSEVVVHYDPAYVVPPGATPGKLDLAALAATQAFAALETGPGGSGLDYVRDGLFDLTQMTAIPASGAGASLKNLLDGQVKRAKADPAAIAIAFGDRFTDPGKDTTFGFSPETGVHDIHMMQGDSDAHASENRSNGDGALFIRYAGGETIALFTRFGTQSTATDASGAPAHIAGTVPRHVEFAGVRGVVRLHRVSGRGGLVDRGHDLLIAQTFLARSAGDKVLSDRQGEGVHLGRELILRRAAPLFDRVRVAGFPAELQREVVVAEGRIETEPRIRGVDAETAAFVQAVARRAGCDDARRKTQRELANVLDLAKARIARRLRREAVHLERLLARDVAERAQTIQADVGQRAAAGERADLPHWPFGASFCPLTASISRTLPYAPPRAIATISRCIASYCSRYAIISLRFAFSIAAIIVRHSAGDVAIGFSHSTCLPATAARTVNSACKAFGKTM